MDFGKPVNFDKLVLQENIATGQQIESFKIYCVIGYKKICLLKRVKTARRIKIVITSYRVKATLLKAEAYLSE